MISLILTIIFSTLLNIVFRLTKDKRVHNLYLITINYWTCTIFALFATGFPHFDAISPTITKHGLIMGLMFVAGFQILGLTIKNYGISVATVIQKVSLIIPVGAAFLIYNTLFTVQKVVGILLALVAIFMVQKEIKFKKDPISNFSLFIVLLPILCFLISGIVDSGFLVMAERKIAQTQGEIQLLTGVIFAAAALTGTIISFIWMFSKEIFPSQNDLLYGVLLGIPNFFSVRFLYEAVDQITGEIVFPIFNSGIIVIATIAGYFIFNEKLNKLTILGIVIACVSIVILSMEA